MAVLPIGQATLFDEALFFDSANPLSGFVGECTWYCWSMAKSRAKANPTLGINYSDLPTSNANNWYASAKASGYTVSSTPRADSIAVWKNNSGSGGHVAYVIAWNGTSVDWSETNVNSSLNGGRLQVDSRYKDAVIAGVKKATESKITVLDGGTDGLYKLKSQSDFEGKHSTKTFLGYIYLN